MKELKGFSLYTWLVFAVFASVLFALVVLSLNPYLNLLILAVAAFITIAVATYIEENIKRR
jgi:hypothetical protein